MPEFELITDLPRLLETEPAWRTLADHVADVTPFQLPEWQLTWWSHFGSGQLRVFSWWDQESLVAILPCFLHEWQGRRQLTLIGSGISDYLEPLICPHHASFVLETFQTHLETSNEWDLCNWQDLSAGTRFAQLRNSSLEPDTPCSEVQLVGSFEEFWSRRSKDLRRNFRRYTERACALGELSFSVVDDADEEVLDALIHLHAVRWQQRGEPGMIAANHSAAFLRAVAPVLSTRGLLRFFVIRFQKRIAAVMMAFVFRQAVYSYLSAFDPQHEILGFGRVLLYEAFRHAYEHGCAAWNFCRGDEPYKFSWGARLIEKRRLLLTRDKDPGTP